MSKFSAALLTSGNVLYYVFLPFIWLLKILLIALLFISAPLLHVGHYLLHALLWPVHLLWRLETFYIYFGVAILVGIMSGALLHYTISFVAAVLGIERGSEERGRSLSSYRAEKAEKQAKKAGQTSPKVGLKPLRLVESLKDEQTNWLKQEKSFHNKGLLSTTILEEDDSSDAGFL